jgi:osmotically-inducible protein OsmY
MFKSDRIFKFMICLGLITAFVGCNLGITAIAAQKSDTAGQYVDDSTITAKVKAEIFNEPTLKTLQIKVKTHKGIVQLSGFVDSEESVKKAGEIATGVAGVKSVKNNLIVRK